MDKNKIAVVDYNNYTSGDPEKRKNFIKYTIRKKMRVRG